MSLGGGRHFAGEETEKSEKSSNLFIITQLVSGEPGLSPDALVTECALGLLTRASSSIRTSPAHLLLPLANSPDGHSGHIAGR